MIIKSKTIVRCSGKAVASYAEGLWFDSGHEQFLFEKFSVKWMD